MKQLRPMLASPAPENIEFPVFASRKLDGIRALVKKNDTTTQVISRMLKPFPNEHVQRILGNPLLAGLDGEITVGAANDSNVMQATTSGLMSEKGEPDFTYWVFDFWTDTKAPFIDRHSIMQGAVKKGVFDAFPNVKLLDQQLVLNHQELNAYEKAALEEGYEGVMIRSPKGLYKYGRSTAREGYLLKVKRFEDSEAMIINAEEFLSNKNELTYDALGYAKRSTMKEGMQPMDMLGALVVTDMKTNITFNIGSGFTMADRKELWEAHRQGKLVGLIVKYKHFANAGVKDAPRFPVFVCFRSPIDM